MPQFWVLLHCNPDTALMQGWRKPLYFRGSLLNLVIMIYGFHGKNAISGRKIKCDKKAVWYLGTYSNVFFPITTTQILTLRWVWWRFLSY